ncbi:hypothetical protein B0J12DRAFT_753676 [Macrophomina phaseolina]|uniref:Zn(2)-C6 fungal-type domain-containing protein n=1 Tax=Macrophomina phaseolina TaxID=35725 RepID=A0ABQ8GDS1_9PEZI|nr:hypothetical protein B0J12DRAFT_753676 [Macrophomina phaseolina]
MLPVGPFDKRTFIRRCNACRRRKIKCVGATPCEYCQKTRQFCFRDAVAKPNALVFVSSGLQAPTSWSRQKTTNRGEIQSASLSTSDDWVIAYFFEQFLKTNNFADGLWTHVTSHLHQLLHTSPALRSAITAVAILDSSRRPSSRSNIPHLTAQEKALQIYSNSLTALQSAICTYGAAEHTIWATFFLGLFELMMGSNSTNWDRHFLYGTSNLLRARGPATFRQGSGKVLFLTLRFFEVSRCLIYDESSFLMESAWSCLLAALREESGVNRCLSEAVFDVMLRCSDLCSRLLNSTSESPSDFDGFMEEGACLRVVTEMLLRDCRKPDPKSPDDLAAFVFLHATSIYLSGIFDRRLHLFSTTPSAILSPDRVGIHVASILNGTEAAIDQTRLCGLLFLYPLRVAAARAATSPEQKRIADTFAKIGQQGFAIVRVFQEEITEVWSQG